MIQTFEACGKTIEDAIDAAMLLAGDVSSFETDVEVLESGSRGIFGIGGKLAKVRISFDNGIKETPIKKEFKPKEAKPIEFKIEDAKPSERKPATPKPQVKATPVKTIEAKPQIQAQRPLTPAPRPKSLPENRTVEKKSAFDAVSVKRRDFSAVSREAGAVARTTVPAIKTDDAITDIEKSASLAAIEFLQGVFARMELSPEVKTVFTSETICLYFSGKNLGALIGRRGETLNALQYLANLVVNHKIEGGEHVRLILDVEGYREEREETLVALAKKMADKCIATDKRVELEPMNPHERRIVHIALEQDTRVETLSYGSDPYRKVVITPKGKKIRN